jgi:hypothetical protein
VLAEHARRCAALETRVNAAPWRDRSGIGWFGLLWRIPLVVPMLLVLAAVVLYLKTLEWRGR